MPSRKPVRTAQSGHGPRPRFRALVGTGGIGAGSFFLLQDNRTLQREESRGGHFLDRRDYCKLHIIAHYVKRITGPGFKVIPIGKVGDDETGRRLLVEMRSAGLDLHSVQTARAKPTLFSFCFLYPDGSGGNLTTENSAAATVTPAYINQHAGSLKVYGGKALVLAAPEVPLAARRRLLELATRWGAFRVASFTSTEIGPAHKAGFMQMVDLLAINMAEAAALTGQPDNTARRAVIDRAVRTLRNIQPDIMISITGGAAGSWFWDGAVLHRQAVLPVKAVCTAGAGDAHIAGIIAGYAAGLPVTEAHRLGNLTAAMSVTAPHTIHPGIDRDALRRFARRHAAPLSPPLRRFLASC